MPEDVPTWVDGAGGGTPLNATDLNKVSTAIRDLDAREAVVESRFGTVSAQTPTPGALIVTDASGKLVYQPVGNFSGQVLATDLTQATKMSWRGSIGHAISANATFLTQRDNLTFTGPGVLVTDDPLGTHNGGFPSTTITIPGDTLIHAIGNSGSSLTIDAGNAAGFIKTITLTANCTFTLTGAVSGLASTIELLLHQDGTGSRTVTWPTNVNWGVAGTPTLTTTANLVDWIILRSYDGGATWYGYVVGKGFGQSPVAPGAPTGVTAAAGNTQATVSFSPPASNGGSSITSYTATSSPGGFHTSGAGSPLVVTGLTNGTAYTFTVTATNSVGTSSASSASSAVTPSNKAAALIDTFNGTVVDTSKWTVSGSTLPAQNNGMVLPCTNGYTNCTSVSLWDLTSSSIYVNPTAFPDSANASAETIFQVSVTNNLTDAKFLKNQTTLYFRVNNNSATASDTSITFDPVAHAWWRLREASGVLFWDTSPDGTTWTNRRSFTYSGWSLTATSVSLQCGHYTAGTDPAPAQFNNVNITPVVAVPGVPTIGTASPGNAIASVAFTPPASNGGAPITSYTATSSPGGVTGSAASSPITVTGLTNGTSYTFTVTATNSVGTSTPSAASNVVTPSPGVLLASTAIIPNPERGFFTYSETHYQSDQSGYVPLDQTALISARTGSSQTLVFRYFVMERYLTRDTIDAAYLTLLANDFTTVRNAGCKVIIRFTYSTSGNISAPPYNSDPPVARVLSHISQLTATLNANADVIDTIEAGFIGMWGEWYYTDNFGDQGITTTTQWNNRISVLDALYNNLDTRIFIAVRYIGIKQQWLAGETRDGGRIGFHNDAFLAPFNDYGTFTTFSTMDVPTTQTYLANQTALGLPMGHESAASNSPHSDWPEASAELAQYHFTFLNPQYHPDVLSSWGPNKDIAAKNLGYRLRLTSASVPSSVAHGASTSITLNIANDGYARPYRSRVAQVVLTGPVTYKATTTFDVKTCLPGTTTTGTLTFTAPATTGTYAVHVAFPDPSASLANTPAYAIQLANVGVWDSTNGWNDLGQNITVT